MSFYLTSWLEAWGRTNSQHEVNIITLQQLLTPFPIALFFVRLFCMMMKIFDYEIFNVCLVFELLASNCYRLQFFLWCDFIWQAYLKLSGINSSQHEVNLNTIAATVDSFSHIPTLLSCVILGDFDNTFIK